MEQQEKQDLTCSSIESSTPPYISIYVLILVHYTSMDPPCEWCTRLYDISLTLDVNVTFHLINFVLWKQFNKTVCLICRRIWQRTCTTLVFRNAMYAQGVNNSNILLNMIVMPCLVHWVNIGTHQHLNPSCQHLIC